MTYPKRLIEVDLPIREISAHARREKSIRHGHISTLHIWWARRPLAACRAVLCAALWPDPADELCPPAFRNAAAAAMVEFASKVRQDRALLALCEKHWPRWNGTVEGSYRWDDPATWADLRSALLDFIADFANWDASTVPAFLDTARGLTQAAHEALGGAPGTRPLVVDPFAGGGSIPLEALRVGADAFASDLNPVAVLLNKVVLEYIPKYGNADLQMRDAEGQERTFHGLAGAVRYWGGWVKEQAEKELGQFYPKDPDGATPIAYLWARTVRCEGPGCGAEVPLVRSLWLAKKGQRSVALRLLPDRHGKRVDFAIVERATAADVGNGTVKRGSATCPVCGFTTAVARVREQLKTRRGGAADARLLCVVTTRPSEQGRFYRLPTERDLEAVRQAAEELERRKREHVGELSLVPDEEISFNEIRRISVPLYGMTTWGDLFTPRQALAICTFARAVTALAVAANQSWEPDTANAIVSACGMCMTKVADLANSCCRWEPVAECPRQLFARQAVGMTWDFAEGVPIGASSGSFDIMIDRFAHVLDNLGSDWRASGATQAPAGRHPLPDDSAHAFVTDPPYYDSVPYAYLSDFFYVWLRRSLSDVHPGLFSGRVVPKDEEIVVDRKHELSTSTKDVAFYERELTKAFAEGRRVLAPDGIGTVVFASKSTASWEAILQAMLEAGWTLTASWPIDTEMPNKVAAIGQARLMSSIHLVCRPRENPDGSLRTDDVGNWRDVLAELPVRISDWMPRLASEGVVGADAIFACLGPALEIFSRYARVERASGEQVTLREYLEHVWAAVSREALAMIFEDADATGLEEDARLTAMWLWTLSTGANGNGATADATSDDEEEEGDGSGRGAGAAISGFALEFDAARKIAQGLGAHLEALGNLLEVKGDQARLLPVAERTKYLFGKDVRQQAPAPRRAKPQQMTLFAELDAADEEAGWGETGIPSAGKTTLDRVHQAMILFAAGRAEALKRFLVEEGVGRDAKMWELAQSLSALYPAGTDEKRWVDGVLARKKSLGF